MSQDIRPLVSILIPAYNARAWIADTIRSALSQSWTNREIIVVDDGSRDDTIEVARRFATDGVSVVAEMHRGAASARNKAFSLSRGDYIQWLDADDLLAPDKIARQLSSLNGNYNPRILLSSPWARFAYRTERAKTIATSLWQDLAPAEWLFRKMGQNLFMQTGTWLTSRELTKAAGPWDARLLTDDDGEFFCRILLQCEMVRFVPGGGVLYRDVHLGGVSFIGTSNDKMDAMLLSMQLHIKYLMSLEDSPRTRKACLDYMQHWLNLVPPRRRDIVEELYAMAGRLGGSLRAPHLRWKYTWMRPIVGHQAAWHAQLILPHFKARLLSEWDRLMRKSKAGSGKLEDTPISGKE